MPRNIAAFRRLYETAQAQSGFFTARQARDAGYELISRFFRGCPLDGHCPLSITLDALFCIWHNTAVAWEVEGIDEFAVWFEALTDDEQVSVGRVVELLVEHGPSLPFPYSSGIATSRHRHMRELRIQHEGRPYRVLYAFDPRRAGILLLGGDKTGNDRWYEEQVPVADGLYDEHLRQLEREGLI